MMEPGLATVRFLPETGRAGGCPDPAADAGREWEPDGPVRQVTLGYQIVERGSL